MKPVRRTLTLVFIAVAVSLFCVVMMASLSYLMPLNCPPDSKVIGIECFDAAYNNTTSWYRLYEGAAIARFPVWLVVSLVAVVGVSRFQLPDSPPTPVFHTNHAKQIRAQDKNWLPTNYPHCGGTLSSQNVTWLDAAEARCPYCGTP